MNDNIYNYLQVLRSDFNSVKVDLVNKIMKLSEDDAKKFWPIYRNYENELGDQSISRAELVTEFVQAHRDGTFDNSKATDIAKRWFKSQRARLDLLEKISWQNPKSPDAGPGRTIPANRESARIVRGHRRLRPRCRWLVKRRNKTAVF